jgi:serine/threonine-protein kinase TNNI3K
METAPRSFRLNRFNRADPPNRLNRAEPDRSDRRTFFIDSNGVDLAARGPPDPATISFGVYSNDYGSMGSTNSGPPSTCGTNGTNAGGIQSFDAEDLQEEASQVVGQHGISIVGKIGIGFSSVVFCATGPEEAGWSPVAVKVVESGRCGQSEVENLSKIKHPNIVHFYCCFQGPPLCYVFEYCSGGDLFKVLHESSVPVSTRSRVSIACDMASALAYIHGEGMMHRDVKSPNVLLSEPIRDANQAPDAKLADFGLSKDVNGQASVMTKGVGTARWMAPEAMGTTYGRSADVYSFSILLWELLSRKVPYGETRSLQALTMAVFFEGVRPDVEACRGVSPEILELMPQCWSKHADSRPCMTEVHAILHTNLHQLPDKGC